MEIPASLVPYLPEFIRSFGLALFLRPQACPDCRCDCQCAPVCPGASVGFSWWSVLGLCFVCAAVGCAVGALISCDRVRAPIAAKNVKPLGTWKPIQAQASLVG